METSEMIILPQMSMNQEHYNMGEYVGTPWAKMLH